MGKGFVIVLAILAVAAIQSTEARGCAGVYQSCQHLPCCPEHMGIPVSCERTSVDYRCLYSVRAGQDPEPTEGCFLTRCAASADCCESSPTCLNIPVFPNRCI